MPFVKAAISISAARIPTIYQQPYLLKQYHWEEDYPDYHFLHFIFITPPAQPNPSDLNEPLRRAGNQVFDCVVVLVIGPSGIGDN